LKGGRCVATDATCQASPNCTSDGACTAKNGKCVVTAESCPKLCESDGKCTFSGTACIASAESCRASSSCEISGECRLRCDGVCIVDDAGCAASFVCKKQGRCHAGNDRCVKR
jgi:hypothetical protein